MSPRGFAAAAALAALALVFVATGIGNPADQGRGVAAAAAKASKQTTKRGRRGPRGPVGHAGPAGRAGKDGAAGKVGAAGKEGPAGAEGPGAVISIHNLAISEGGVNHKTIFAFVGETVTANFDARTTAQATASLDFASSDGEKVEAAFGICAQPEGGTEIRTYWAVNIDLHSSAGIYVAQTATAIVGVPAPGRWEIGACTARETTNMRHGVGAATVIFAEAEGGRAA